ncbi:MAG: rubrerythrin family protein, partial [Promethearchaeota archaeon]
AEREGYKNVTLLFRAIAEAETIHALNHHEIYGVKDTSENLKVAIEGENYEVTTMYPNMLKQAKEDKNEKAIRSFTFALEAEKIHEKLYSDALQKVMDGNDIDIRKVSICTVCGYTVVGDPPDECPICKAKKEKFKIFE